MQQSERYLQAKKVTLIGALINALLGTIKLIGGMLFHSHALAADGIHSFSDLITDGTVGTHSCWHRYCLGFHC